MDFFRRHQRHIATSFLAAGLLGSIELAFSVTPADSYVVVYTIASMLEAAGCLFLVWGILGDSPSPVRRLLWMLTGIATIVISSNRLWGFSLHAALYSLGWLLPFGCGSLLVRWRGYQVRTPIFPQSSHRHGHFRLVEVFAFVTVSAYIFSLLARMRPSLGWISRPVPADIGVLLATHSFFLGLILSPTALATLKPLPWSIWAATIFGLVCLLDPVVTPWVIKLISGVQWPAPQFSQAYYQIVPDNALWYSSKVLPTVSFFALLRIAGARIESRDRQVPFLPNAEIPAAAADGQ